MNFDATVQFNLKTKYQKRSKVFCCVFNNSEKVDDVNPVYALWYVTEIFKLHLMTSIPR